MSLRVAIVGTRGVPAAYGGFETFAEELGARLVARGHRVTVYGRSHVVPPLRTYRGMRVRRLPTIRHKYLDTLAHTALSMIDAVPKRFDVVLVCNNANAPFAALPRLSGARVVLNVDGLEWERAKWGRLGRAYYRMCAWLAPRLPVVLVSDARVIATYFKERYGARSEYIPYGTDAEIVPPGEALTSLGLTAGEYMLYVSRLEPENNALLVIDAYRRAGGLKRMGIPLVVVGDAPYASAYRGQVEAAANDTPGVILAGYQFGPAYGQLQSNCRLYVQATEVGGTHPALVEAMGRGVPVVANDVPEHREVLADAGLYYERGSAASLAARLLELYADEPLRARLGNEARSRAIATFSWDAVTTAYETLFLHGQGGER